MRPIHLGLLGLLAALSASCDSPPAREVKPSPPSAKKQPLQTHAPHSAVKPVASPRIPAFSASTFKAPGRLVAIGDLHGDVHATRAVLRLAGAIDDKDQWVGGNLVVVQTGDQLDRGDEEREILDLLSQIETQAAAAGGAVHVLSGNHETMNVAGDFRYVTPGGFEEFSGIEPTPHMASVLQQLPEHAHARAAAFFPGGKYARKIAKHPVVAVVGESVFAHGGVLYKHVSYGIDRLNAEVERWMLGEAGPPAIIQTPDAPVWSRLYSDGKPRPAACAELSRVLDALGVERMVVGHTVQKEGVTSACNDRIWRIDVGMSSHYGGSRVEALEIKGGKVRVLRAEKSALDRSLPKAKTKQ